MKEMNTYVAAAARGDRDAFARVIADRQSMVRSIALAIIGDLPRSEEVAQDVFLAAWRGLPRLENHERFDAWLRGITRNLARKAIRRAREDSLVVEPPSGAPSALDSLVSAEEARLVEEALGELSEESREALVLYYRAGCSVEEVAARLGVSEDVVKKRLSRGRERIRAEVLGSVAAVLVKTPLVPARVVPRLPAQVARSLPRVSAVMSAGAAGTLLLALAVGLPDRSAGGMGGGTNAVAREESRASPSTEENADAGEAADATRRGVPGSRTLPPVSEGAGEEPAELPEDEAKRHLAGMLVAERAYRAAHGAFTDDLVALDWFPGAETPTYVFGFCPGKESAKKARSHTMSPEVGAALKADPYSFTKTLPLADPCRTLESIGIAPGQFRATAEGFKAFAIGNLDDDPDLDVWAMGHDKRLERLRED